MAEASLGTQTPHLDHLNTHLNVVFLIATLLSMPLVGQPVNEPQEESASRCSTTDLCIRIENASDIDFDKFVVRFPDQAQDFGPLKARTVTAYRRIGRAYDYNYTEAVAADRKFYLVIIDHIGDRFLPTGTYTLRYRVNVLAEALRDKDFVLHGYLHSALQRD